LANDLPCGVFASEVLEVNILFNKTPIVIKNRVREILDGPDIPNDVCSHESLLDVICPIEFPQSVSVISSNLSQIAEGKMNVLGLDELHCAISDAMVGFSSRINTNEIVRANFRLPKDFLPGEEEIHYSTFASGIWGKIHSAVKLVLLDSLIFDRSVRSPGKVAEDSLRNGVLPLWLQNGWRHGNMLGLRMAPRVVQNPQSIH
jgi:hypothetical protein